MKYLFGDTTPFPLDENFIETLQSLTDCCVSLLRIDGTAQTSRRAADAARAEADKEIADLDRLAGAVKGVLNPRVGKSETNKNAAELAAERLVAAVDNAVAQNRAVVLRKRDQAVDEVGLDGIADKVVEALQLFLRKNQLPHSEWRLRWKGGLESAEAHVTCTAECGLQAVMEVAMPAKHTWSTAVPVSQLAPGLSLEIPGERGWLRRGKRARTEALGKLFVTQLEVSDQRNLIVLSRGKRELSNAFEIAIPTAGGARPTLKRLEGNLSESIELDGRNQDAIVRLWAKVEATVGELTGMRKNIVLATLNNQSVREIPRPQTIAEAILDSAGPLVREMRQRSRMPGEITLKRELGCGRREELFVPKEDLQRRFADLAPEYRKVFEVYGLDATSEIAIKDLETMGIRGRSSDATVASKRPPAPPTPASAMEKETVADAVVMPNNPFRGLDRTGAPHTIPRGTRRHARTVPPSAPPKRPHLVPLASRGNTDAEEADTNVRRGRTNDRFASTGF